MFLPSDAARRLSSRRVALALVVAFAFGAGPGCFATDNGPEPPPQQLYFPTAVLASPKGGALYVVNSDFDLQYKAGTVIALDLDRVRRMIPELHTVGLSPPEPTVTTAQACRRTGIQSDAGSILYPGACNAFDVNAPPDANGAPDPKGTLVKGTVSLGAFAADATISLRPIDATNTTPGARLLIPVRGDPSLTWIDIDDERTQAQRFTLECHQASNGGHCADDHKAGIDPAENTRGVTMPSEPFALAVSDDQKAVVVSHQTTGTASLFLNTWDTPPTMAFVLGGLPTGVTGVLSFPKPKLVREFPEYPYRPGFLFSYRTAAEVDVARYYDDAAASPARPFLTRTSRIGISTNAIGFDSRGTAIDVRARKEAEAACDKATLADADYRACLASAAGAPVAAFSANRIPPTLLVGQTTTNASAYGTDDSVYFYDAVPLSQGPSRVYVGQVWDDRDPDPTRWRYRTRVFALCFDARTLYVYDPDAKAMEAVVLTGRGPSALAFDPMLGKSLDVAGDQPTQKHDFPNGNYAYLAHFTDSYLGVLDLDMSHTTYLTFVASLGPPAPPRESK